MYLTNIDHETLITTVANVLLSQKIKLNINYIISELTKNNISNYTLANTQRILRENGIELLECSQAKAQIIEQAGIYYVYNKGEAIDSRTGQKCPEINDGQYYLLNIDQKLIPKRPSLIKELLKNVNLIQYILLFSFIFILGQIIFYTYMEIYNESLQNNFNLFFLIFLMISLSLVNNGLEYFSYKKLYYEYQQKVDTRIINDLIKQPLLFFTQRKVGDISSKLMMKNVIRDVIIIKGLTLIFDSITLIIGLIYLLHVSLFIGSVILIIATINTFGSYLIAKKIKLIAQKATKVRIELNAYNTNIISKIDHIKINNQESTIITKWNKLNAENVKMELKLKKYNILLNVFKFNLSSLATVLIIYLTLHYAQIYQIIVIQMLYSKINVKLNAIVQFYVGYEKVIPMFEKLDDIIDYKILSKNDDVFQKKLTNSNLAFKLNNVNVRYNNKKVYNNDLNLAVNKHERVLIKGDNGSGKSTLIKILLNVITPFKGEMELDENLTIAPFLQKENYIATTVKEYIGADISQKELEKYLQLFDLDNRIEDVQMRLDENAQILSGGELKRLQIIKNILSDKQLIIFDEPESFLDPKSIQVFNDLLFNSQKLKDKTIIVISHHNFNPNFDKIYHL